MAIVQYTARVKGSRLLELPEEAQSLCLQPGEEIDVSVERNVNEAGASFPPNEIGLAAMRKIAENQQHRPAVEGANVVKLVREARTGALQGYAPAE